MCILLCMPLSYQLQLLHKLWCFYSWQSFVILCQIITQRSSKLMEAGWSHVRTDVPDTIASSTSGITAGSHIKTASIGINLCWGRSPCSPQSAKPIGTGAYHNAGRNGVIQQSVLAWLEQADRHPWFAGCAAQQCLKSGGGNSRLASGKWIEFDNTLYTLIFPCHFNTPYL